MSVVAPVSIDSSIVEQIDAYYEKIGSVSITNLKNIQVFKKEQLCIEKFNKKTLSVSYPSLWFSPIPLCPFADTIEEETIEWMKKLGMIPNKKVEENIRKMEPRHLAGYSLCLANYDYALVYCKFITLWLLFDDVVVETADKPESIMPAFDALAGNLMSTAHLLSPFVVAYKEIGDEYERLGASRQWRERLADGMKEWARFSVQEALVKASNKSRTLEEALHMRFVTIGLQPSTVIMERTIGLELADEILKDPLFQKCIDLASIICALVNDLVGIGKDLILNQIQTNLILFHFNLVGKSLEDSCQAIIDIHDRTVDEFDSCAAELLQRVDSAWKQRLHWFFMVLRYMDTGHAKWHQNCIRYSQYVLTEGDHAFQICIKSR